MAIRWSEALAEIERVGEGRLLLQKYARPSGPTVYRLAFPRGKVFCSRSLSEVINRARMWSYSDAAGYTDGTTHNQRQP